MTAARRKLFGWIALAAAGVALVAGANAHLVTVAVGSQPDCVPHLKTPGGDGAFRAAKPSC